MRYYKPEYLGSIFTSVDPLTNKQRIDLYDDKTRAEDRARSFGRFYGNWPSKGLLRRNPEGGHHAR